MDAAIPVPDDARHGRRDALVATAVVATVSIAIWMVFGTTPGPLAHDGGGLTRSSAPADVGDRLTFGVDSPVYHGSGDLVIDSIVPDNLPAGLQLLGVGAIPWGHGGIGVVRSFPPGVRYPLRPVRGWVVRPGEDLSVAVGVRARAAGVFLIRGWTISYHRGWHHYSTHYAEQILVCAPMRAAGCS